MKHRNVATYRLHHGRSKKAILEIIADDAPGLFRIVWLTSACRTGQT